MELIWIIFLLLIFTAIGIVVVAKKSKNLPPGPWQLPVVGSMHHLMMGGGGSLPHRRFRDLSEAYGPLMHLKLGQVSLVVASSAEAAREIMKTHDHDFATRPLFHTFNVISYGGKTLSSAPYGEYWRQLRKVSVVELLSAKRVLSFRSDREEEVAKLIHSISLSLSSSNMVDLGKLVTSSAYNIAATAAIGSKYKEDQKDFLKVMEEIIQLVAGFQFADMFPSLSWLLGSLVSSKRRVERAHRKMDDILEGVLQEHQAHRHDHHDHDKEDFVDVLLRLQADRAGDLRFHLTADCIKAVTLDMFLGGSETASTVLLWAMSELMKNPRVMRKAQSELRETITLGGSGKTETEVTEPDISKLNYLQVVIKETLRLHPPAPLLMPRECRKTCEILGYTIPEKTRVVVNVWAIGRDPEYWGRDAEEFKPERFEGSGVDFRGTSFEFLPFGAGRRMCPGMLLGIANVELALARLLYHFEWKLPAGIEPEDFDMGESLGISLRRSSDLCLHASQPGQAISK